MKQTNIKTIITIINYTFKIIVFFVLWANIFKNVKKQNKYTYFKTSNI